MLHSFLMSFLEDIPLNERQKLWFLQDGASSHTSRQCMKTLRQMFPGRLISRYGDINWPPRSPDLTAPDFFLWGYFKHEVYKKLPSSIPELKHAIQTEIRNIQQDTIHRVMHSIPQRLQECLENRSGHLLDVIFKKQKVDLLLNLFYS